MVKTERNRYIVFEVKTPSSLSRQDLITVFQRGVPVRPWLVIYEGRRGIVRCTNKEKEQVIVFLKSLKSIAGRSVEIATLVTSGTIRCAKERLAKS